MLNDLVVVSLYCSNLCQIYAPQLSDTFVSDIPLLCQIYAPQLSDTFVSDIHTATIRHFCVRSLLLCRIVV